MGITQSLNSKANVKKATANDLPFSPAQPVINSFYGTSTAGQTVINLGFTIQAAANGATAAFTDIFWLFVDGKKLDLGSSNDYTFTSIASDGTSSQVTLNFSLPAGFNIQAFKLGLKPEIQFGMDNRFTQLYANQASGFQGFVSQTDAITTATTTVGSPAAGTFYSSITGRAPIVDLSQDLKPRFGIERIMTPSIQQIQTEFGPSSQIVFSAVNDTIGQVRFVGPGWTNSNTSVGITAFSNLAGDYVEITFYGTGLNWLDQIDGTVRSVTYSVDGGSTTSLSISNTSGVLNSRNYGMNVVRPVVSGLSLGTHTITITNTSSSNFFTFYGFEILNQYATGSNLVTVNPGVVYNQGQKSVLSAQSTLAYNASVVGTTGGRVVEYITAAGTRGQAFTQNATSPSYLTASSHTNEEVSRTYSWREFGASRSDDFSGNFSNGANLAFTIDDGTTNLNSNSAYANNANAIIYSNVLNSFVTFTFVGTGVDIIRQDDNTGSGTDTFTFYINGVSVGTDSTGSTKKRQYKIASGLPYGTHTLKIQRTSAPTSFDLGIQQFVVYQPKTPSIPSGATQVGSYNVMANFVANTTQGAEFRAQGILRKNSTREFLYVGTWTQDGTLSASGTGGPIGGQRVLTTTTGASISYTFFGTGFDFRCSTPSTTATSYQVTVDGSSNLSSYTTGFYGNISSFTASTGVVSYPSASGAYGSGFYVNGLTLGVHTLTVSFTSGQSLSVEAIDIITPIHSPKSNLYADFQNTLTVGSNAISDDRQTTPIKNALPATKASAMAVGITSNPTTTASYTAMVPMPDMSVIVKTSGGALDIQFYGDMNNNGAGNGSNVQIYVDGVAVGPANGDLNAPSNGYNFQVVRNWLLNVVPGFHIVQVYWGVYSGTLSNYNTSRVLIVKEK